MWQAVASRQVETLTLREFHERFALGPDGCGSPLLVRGGADAMVGGEAGRWSLAMLRQRAGGRASNSSFFPLVYVRVPNLVVSIQYHCAFYLLFHYC